MNYNLLTHLYITTLVEVICDSAKVEVGTSEELNAGVPHNVGG